MMMIQRSEMLQKLTSFQDKQLIKVVTGIRRCGKSTLLSLFMDHLRAQGVEDTRIQSINFEDMGNARLMDPKALHEHITDRLIQDVMNYIFLDEIQNVQGFERVVDSLYIRRNVDLYITGSNAQLLSGEIATLLSGRYIEIRLLPLSFREYVSTYPDRTDLPRKYRDYLLGSSFPYARELSTPEQVRIYLEGLYNTVMLKDVVARTGADASMLDSITRFMFDNIGNLCSFKKISDTMTSAGRKIAPATVESYLSALVSSFILYRAGRYDIKGKQYLKTGEKYYAVDMGLRYYLLGTKEADVGHMLENVIYLELIRRGYEVHIGKVGQAEIDFVSIEPQGTVYYQVAATVRDPDTLARELMPLRQVADHYHKCLLTLDDDPPASYDGIVRQNALDWLLANRHSP